MMYAYRSGLQIMDAPMWKAVREFYYQDRVVEALDEAERLGGFDSNDSAAEATVRRHGKRWDVRPWLTVEALPDEAGASMSRVLEIVGSECDHLSRQFGWDNREATLVTFLPMSYESGWMPGRWGFFVDKVPYDKICLPYHLLHDAAELRRGIRHEFMHAITTNLANGHDPRWLAEAMSTLVEGRLSQRSWEFFKHSPGSWLNPEHLVGTLTTDHRDPEKAAAVTLAYDQASFLGLFLYLDGGAERTAALLKAVGDESLLLNLELEALGRTRADGALRRVYHVSERVLFEQTL